MHWDRETSQGTGQKPWHSCLTKEELTLYRGTSSLEHVVVHQQVPHYWLRGLSLGPIGPVWGGEDRGRGVAGLVE